MLHPVLRNNAIHPPARCRLSALLLSAGGMLSEYTCIGFGFCIPSLISFFHFMFIFCLETPLTAPGGAWHYLPLFPGFATKFQGELGLLTGPQALHPWKRTHRSFDNI